MFEIFMDVYLLLEKFKIFSLEFAQLNDFNCISILWFVDLYTFVDLTAIPLAKHFICKILVFADHYLLLTGVLFLFFALTIDCFATIFCSSGAYDSAFESLRIISHFLFL
jgi:hypothetical protein